MTTVERLAEQLERSFHGGAWHGPALSEVLDGVDARLAVRHPLEQAHSIADIVRHLTTWYEVPRRRLERERVAEVPEEVDWPPDDRVTEASWRRTVAALEEAHRLLHARVTQLSDDDLGRPVSGSDPTVGGLLLGIIQHNAYHAGQIAILRKAGS